MTGQNMAGRWCRTVSPAEHLMQHGKTKFEGSALYSSFLFSEALNLK